MPFLFREHTFSDKSFHSTSINSDSLYFHCFGFSVKHNLFIGYKFGLNLIVRCTISIFFLVKLGSFDQKSLFCFQIIFLINLMDFHWFHFGLLFYIFCKLTSWVLICAIKLLLFYYCFFFLNKYCFLFYLKLLTINGVYKWGWLTILSSNTTVRGIIFLYRYLLMWDSSNIYFLHKLRTWSFLRWLICMDFIYDVFLLKKQVVAIFFI